MLRTNVSLVIGKKSLLEMTHLTARIEAGLARILLHHPIVLVTLGRPPIDTSLN